MSSALKTQFDPSWNEADQLISILRKWGITYLVGEGTPYPLPTWQPIGPQPFA